MEEGIVHQHENDARQKAAEHHAQGRDGERVCNLRSLVQVPEGAQGGVFQKDHKIVNEQPAACPAFLDVEPTEDIDDPHHHVEHDLLPFGDTEFCLTVDDPEGHDAPVKDDEDAKVQLENGGKEGERDDPGCDREEVPAKLDDDRHVADGLLVISRVPQGLLVGGQGPSQGHQGGCCGETYKGKQEDILSKVRRGDALEVKSHGAGGLGQPSTSAKVRIFFGFLLDFSLRWGSLTILSKVSTL